ncbi:MAG: hypothetical protein H8E28_07260 [Anaerolineae bacterium]|nr:hypothetical protein [Anaerolineae bacterium]MBL6964929.1 hypothetical protein [Anaerolineales bacterium]
MKKNLISFLFVLAILCSIPIIALAQTYYFSLDQEIVNVYWQEDGTLALEYVLFFTNGTGVSPIDFVDVGIPNNNYSISNITADVDGHPILDIESSPYVDNGVALGLGSNAIQPGQSGRVRVAVAGIRNVLYTDSTDSAYASAVFSPTWFGSEYVYGSTDITVIYHLPPGVTSEEPRWHASPSGFPDQPQTAIDNQGRVMYTWQNPNANGYTQYKFGASFPKSYVPESAIYAPGLLERLGIDPDAIIGLMCCGGFGLFFVFLSWVGNRSAKKRKMKYLPPKIRIEGHGIKRGLTAVEAAILMEHPADKVLTMILFAVLKKEAASVISQDPLKLDIQHPIDSKLRSYEQKFLEAFRESKAAQRRKKLQDLMIDLIKSVSTKMKGFSHKESVAYYKHIMQKAWQQIEQSDTPEVRSERYDEHMGWTMLDKDFDQRTQDVFRSGPVFVPIWWNRYDPTWSRKTISRPVSTSSMPGSGSGRSASSMPSLPGGEFAASMVTGMQGFASDVVGNVTDFTNRVTNKTNPVPKPTSSGSRSSGGSCACACACAGCACACAGGGR